MYPELGWNELFVLICFSVFELHLIWKSAWHKERLKQFGICGLILSRYIRMKSVMMSRKEEQTFVVYHSSFLKSIEMIRELHIYCPNISEVWYWNVDKHILGECRGHSMDICIHTCNILVFCHEGGTSTEQKAKKEISEQTVLTHYWEPGVSEQQIVWR